MAEGSSNSQSDYRIGVVACHPRADAAHTLGEEIHAVYVSIDDKTLGCDGNHRKVWDWLRNNTADADWLVVVEDDAIPTQGFNTQLGAMLTASPFPIVGLYLGTGRPPHIQSRLRSAVAQAEVKGASFITTDLVMHGVGIAIKADLVTDMLGYADTVKHPFDQRIRDWARRDNHTVGFCTPSLLDHADQATLFRHPDMQPRSSVPRKAWRFGGRQTWTDRTIEA